MLQANKVPTWTSCRYLMGIVGLYCFTVVYMVRINLSVAMVCMVAPRNVSKADDDNLTEISDGCVQANISNRMFKPGTFQWDKSLQGYILSSFFYGYMVTQVPGGWLAERFGGKIVMMVGMTLSFLSTVFTPLAASYEPDTVGPYLLMALRVLLGLATGVAFPAMNALWGKWAPMFERTKLIAFCYAGTMVGNVITLSGSGVLCVNGFAGGWPSIFYVSAICNFMLLLLWWFCIYDSPAKHPRITKVEREFIEESIGDKVEKQPVPWKAIFTSLPVYGIMFTHICNNWGTYTLLTSLPTYMKEVLKFDIKSNGILSALPFVCMFIATLIFSNIVDLVRANTQLSTTVIRKIVQASALVIPAIFMVATSATTCQTREAAVALLTAGVTFTSLTRSGYAVNHVDIAPRYAGILFGITNTVATIPGMVAPSAVSALTPEGSRSEWQMVFYIWGSIYVFGAIMFCILASGEKQAWAMDLERDVVVKDVYELGELLTKESVPLARETE